MLIPERLLFGDGRAWAAGAAAGDVLELAVGTGRNLACYPPAVRLVGIDISPQMLGHAVTRADGMGRHIALVEGDAARLPFPDERFDTVVCTCGLCSVPDEVAAVAEVRRVLRPGGRFVALEHVRSPSGPVRAGQRLLEPLFLRVAADHLLREPLETVRRAGFSVEVLERSRLGLVERLVARRP